MERRGRHPEHRQAGGASSLRAAGLGHVATPSLEAIERRRTQLWFTTFVVMSGLSIVLVTVSFSDVLLSRMLGADASAENSMAWLATSPAIRMCFLGVCVAFGLYVLEKERHLRRIERALIDERVLNSALQNRVRELAALSEIARAINSVEDTDSVLDRILGAALDLLAASDGSIMLADRERGVLRSVTQRFADPTHPTIAAEVLLGEGVPGWVAGAREPLLLSRSADPARFARLVAAASPLQSIMCVPLIHRDELLGVLEICETSARTFNEYDLRVLGLFAENAAVAISNARLFAAERAHVTALEDLDRQRSEFVATLSHELKSPLTSIIGSVRTLRKHGQGLPESQQDEFLQVVERQGERLCALIEEILFASRMEARELRLDVTAVDLAECVREAVAASHARDPRRLATVADGPTPVQVLADPNAVGQVLANLLDNARKYAPGSPVEVQVTAADNEALVTVTDHGPGIPADELRYVFDRFHQGRRTDGDGARRGVGLGLYICANLVAAMGGRIWVRSEFGEGAAFTFTLPALAHPRSAGSTAAPSGERASGSSGGSSGESSGGSSGERAAESAVAALTPGFGGGHA